MMLLITVTVMIMIAGRKCPAPRPPHPTDCGAPAAVPGPNQEPFVVLFSSIIGFNIGFKDVSKFIVCLLFQNYLNILDLYLLLNLEQLVPGPPGSGTKAATRAAGRAMALVTMILVIMIMISIMIMNTLLLTQL